MARAIRDPSGFGRAVRAHRSGPRNAAHVEGRGRGGELPLPRLRCTWWPVDADRRLARLAARMGVDHAVMASWRARPYGDGSGASELRACPCRNSHCHDHARDRLRRIGLATERRLTHNAER